MKRALLQYLACPACKDELRLGREDSAAHADIVDGELVCSACQARYPIRRGVPRFAERGERQPDRKTEQTRRVYNFTWRSFGEHEVEQAWEKHSYQFSDIVPRALVTGEGKLGLDVGCGSGADLRRLAPSGVELIGCDLSEGVEVAVQTTAQYPNVHIVQADLRRLPFREHAFDFIYSYGVLHHLAQPEAGFASLASLLKPGSPLITYLYGDFSERSWAERAALRIVGGVRALTSRLHPNLLYPLCCAATPLVWLCCSMPAWFLRPRWPQLAARIPYHHTRRWPVLAADLFDRFAPPVEWRYDRRGVEALYQRAGLQQVSVRDCRGWVSWGFRPAAPLAGTVPVAEPRGQARSTPFPRPNGGDTPACAASVAAGRPPTCTNSPTAEAVAPGGAEHASR